ncbi:class II fructose-bisphosphate aldolase [Chloroflexota bacterium]
MPLVGIKEILVDARKKKYGIPCLLAGNLEMIIGQIKAAEAQASPLILAYNSGVTPQVPMELAMPLIVNAARQARVPVASILDHGQSLEVAVQAIQLGSSSVMFDGSALPYEENVKQTKEIVRVAHAVGVSVEAELGSIGGSSVEIGMTSMVDSNVDPANYFTDPQRAADFVERTGVDVLAISFGNVHGPYRGEPNLDLNRVRTIYDLADIPLVMHGASGLINDDYGRIIASGISKINYYSAMGRSASQNLKRTMMEADDETMIYHQTISWGIDYFYMETKKLLDLLGCSDKTQ